MDNGSEKLYNTYHSDKDKKDSNVYDPVKSIKDKPLRIIIVFEDRVKTGKEINIP